MDAMRSNQGKPQLSYLLTFPDEPCLWAGPLEGSVLKLGRWYRGELADVPVDDFWDELNGVVAYDAGSEPLPVLVARVAEYGADKYDRGNYLHGRSWSDTCDSLLRHVLALAEGEDIDPESGVHHAGHIMWNVLFLAYCVRHRPDCDDRVRAPRAADAGGTPRVPAWFKVGQRVLALGRAPARIQTTGDIFGPIAALRWEDDGTESGPSFRPSDLEPLDEPADPPPVPTWFRAGQLVRRVGLDEVLEIDHVRGGNAALLYDHAGVGLCHWNPDELEPVDVDDLPAWADHPDADRMLALFPGSPRRSGGFDIDHDGTALPLRWERIYDVYTHANGTVWRNPTSPLDGWAWRREYRGSHVTSVAITRDVAMAEVERP